MTAGNVYTVPARLFPTLQILCRQSQVLRQQPAKGDVFCAIFTGSTPGTSSLLGPTIETLTSLLDGPQSGVYKNALLELCLILPAR